MKRNVLILTFSGALSMTVAPIVVFIGGLVGALLAATPKLSTLPVAALVVGTALGVVPVSGLMQRFGRKPVFIVSAILSAGVSLLASLSIYLSSFWGFTCCLAGLGAGLAVVQQYRFAAMESVAPQQAAKAASTVLLGGLVAAFLGPEIAAGGERIFAAQFAGSFFILAGVCVLSATVLTLYSEVKAAPLEVEKGGESVARERSFHEILRQPVLWVAVMSSSVGYAVMSFIMTATPVSMHHLLEFSLTDTKWVIQSHIMAMFIPSFFSGLLITRYGVAAVIWAGLGINAVCLMIALAGQAYIHFWASLVLLGVAWNFLFVAGTTLLPASYMGQERFKVQGLNDFMVFGLQAVASLSSGVIVYAFGWNGLVLLAFPVLIILGLVLGAWRSSLLAAESAMAK